MENRENKNMGILFGILVIVVIAGLSLKFLKTKKNHSSPAPEPEPPVQKPIFPGKQTIIEAMESLLSLNLMIRTDHELDNDLLVSIEQIIDDIRFVLPMMIERYPGDSLTYEIEKIGKTHLKKIVKEFLDLSISSRQAQHDIFKNTIDNLSQVTKRSRQIIENNETAEFKTMAHFLAGKFSS